MADELYSKYLNCYTPQECYTLLHERQKKLNAEREKEDKREMDAFFVRLNKITGMMNIQESSWVKFTKWCDVMGQDTGNSTPPDFSVGREEIKRESLTERANKEIMDMEEVFEMLETDPTIWDNASSFKREVEELWFRSQMAGTRRKIKIQFLAFLTQLDKDTIGDLLRDGAPWRVPELLDLATERLGELNPEEQNKRRKSVVHKTEHPPGFYDQSDTASQLRYSNVPQVLPAPYNTQLDDYCLAVNKTGANKNKRCGLPKIDGSLYCATHRAKYEANP